MDQPTVKLEIRLATAADRQPIIELIDSIYQEYDDKVCLEGAESELLEIPESYHKIGGEFWVLSDESGNVLGTHGAFPKDIDQKLAGFRRLYLAKHLRGTDFGHQLMQISIDWAWDKGFEQIEFWSDTRFSRAHRFFEKFGFQQDGRVREMLDSHDPYSEYYFFLDRKSSK